MGEHGRYEKICAVEMFVMVIVADIYFKLFVQLVFSHFFTVFEWVLAELVTRTVVTVFLF